MTRLVLSAVVALLIGSFAPAGDWTHWRGPHQTGVADETGLPESFKTDPAAKDSNVVWKAPYPCRSTPVVLNGKVIIINQDGSGLTEGERVMAFDAATGAVAWEHKFNVFFTDIVSSRVGWTSPAGDAETGFVYAHGVQGLLKCLDSKDGRIVWERSLTEEYGRVSGYGGRLVSPLVEGNLVIVGLAQASWGEYARGANRFVAFDKKTGAVVYWSDPCGPKVATYSSTPVAATVNGERLVISGATDGTVLAFQANTGKKAWSYVVAAGAVEASPVVDGSLVYITNREENVDVGENGRVVCVDAAQVTDGKPKLVWEEIGVKAGLASPMVAGGRLYVCDDGGMLFCYDGKTGKRLWKYKYGTNARGSPVFADGKIYLAAVNAKFSILKPEDKRCKELHTQPFFTKDGQGFVEINSTPAVSNGRVYFGTRDEFYCIGKKEWKAPATNPDRLTMTAASTDKPTLALASPADVVVAPGDSFVLTVRLFDAKGVFVKEVPGQWTAPLPPKTPTGAQPPALRGELKGNAFTAVKEVPGQQGVLEGKVGDLVAKARVRVSPRLPYVPDFNKVPTGATPGGWVNAQAKYAIVEKDGRKYLRKTTENAAPPVARANAYITLPDAKDYTITADCLGEKVSNNLPDMGVIASRYTLFLNGNKQELRLVSWEAIPRLDKTIPFPWKPDTFYSFKLTVVQDGDKAIARGKVWPRGDKEPDAWTIEVTDLKPNRHGSAALYGYATGVEPPLAGVLYDNVKVTPNK